MVTPRTIIAGASFDESTKDEELIERRQRVCHVHNVIKVKLDKHQDDNQTSEYSVMRPTTYASRNFGARSFCAIPIIWNESQNNSAIYMPELLANDASIIHVERKVPPKSDAMLEKDPSSHVVQFGELNTIAPKRGIRYVRAISRTEISIARGYVRPGFTTSPPNTDMLTAPLKFQKSVLIKSVPIMPIHEPPHEKHDKRDHDEYGQQHHTVANNTNTKQVRHRQRHRDGSFDKVLCSWRADIAVDLSKCRHRKSRIERIINHTGDPGPIARLESPKRAERVENPHGVASIFRVRSAELSRNVCSRQSKDDREHQQQNESNQRTTSYSTQQPSNSVSTQSSVSKQSIATPSYLR
ncbi:unnamed protein product [Phytophthora lilii]|uniref:Unnamed protein product n=1 Tax=Phytophthora lilii TaxID=2077276 RepID=A0A9W6TJ28_9STRA|nr:unnamed protein product [Phytophthora lilii]